MLCTRLSVKVVRCTGLEVKCLCKKNLIHVIVRKLIMSGKGRGKGGKGLGKGGAKRHRRILRDNIQGITKPAIRRLCRRAGVKRIGGMIYEETRGVVKVFLEQVIRDAVTYTEYARRKTVTAMDVVYALKRQGRTLYGFDGGNRVESRKKKVSKANTGAKPPSGPKPPSGSIDYHSPPKPPSSHHSPAASHHSPAASHHSPVASHHSGSKPASKPASPVRPADDEFPSPKFDSSHHSGSKPASPAHESENHLQANADNILKNSKTINVDFWGDGFGPAYTRPNGNSDKDKLIKFMRKQYPNKRFNPKKKMSVTDLENGDMPKGVRCLIVYDNEETFNDRMKLDHYKPFASRNADPAKTHLGIISWADSGPQIVDRFSDDEEAAPAVEAAAVEVPVPAKKIAKAPRVKPVKPPAKEPAEAPAAKKIGKEAEKKKQIGKADGKKKKVERKYVNNMDIED